MKFLAKSLSIVLIWSALLAPGFAASSSSTAPAQKSSRTAPKSTNTASNSHTNSSKTIRRQSRPYTPPVPSSLWQYMREHFTLDHETDNPRVIYYIYYYQTHTSTLAAVLAQARYYLYPVVQAVRQHNMPMELALLPIIESGFRPYIVSDAGAAGIWQLMPDTAERFKINVDNHWFDGRADTEESTDAALSYLQYLYGFFNDNWYLAVAAYNSGEGNVQSAIKSNAARGQPTDFWSLALPLQTQDYVPKLLAVSAIIESPERYGIYLPSIPNQPLTGKVILKRQLSLDTAARLAGISREILDKLNPGFLQSATPPIGGYYLILPISSLALFEVNYENYFNPRAHWRRYQIQAGDTLQSIAAKTHASIAALQKINKISTKSRLIPGRYLIYQLSVNKTYIVKAGDTLLGVAQKFNISPTQLGTWNHLPTNANLVIGRNLIVGT